MVGESIQCPWLLVLLHSSSTIAVGMMVLEQNPRKRARTAHNVVKQRGIMIIYWRGAINNRQHPSAKQWKAKVMERMNQTILTRELDASKLQLDMDMVTLATIRRQNAGVRVELQRASVELLRCQRRLLWCTK